MAKQTPKKEGTLQNLERILELLEKHEVSEFEWELNGERLKVRTRHGLHQFTELPEWMSQKVPPGSGFFGTYSHPGSGEGGGARVDLGERQHSGLNGANGATVLKAESKVESTAQSVPLKSNQKQIPSPFVGTFYRASSPDADPYVKEGQMVKRGEVLCIIEAMKLMNEIEAEQPGKIISVLVENGQPVEYGEPLFIIES